MSRSTQIKWVTMLFNGGWMTDLGPSYYGTPNADGTFPLPFLAVADNIVYELDGGPHKMPGTSALNSTVIGSATTQITGLYDYWRQGTGGSPVQKHVCTAGTSLYADAADGVFVALSGPALTAGATPNFSTAYDLLIIATDSTSDTPKSYDQTTYQALAGTPPRFSFSEFHKNRHWGAGDFTNPSRVYYTVLGTATDWVGAGSGSIDISPNDGDLVTGLASHKGELIVFKGPNRGSIHRLQGSTPSDFAVVPFISNLGGVWQNSLFRFGDDLGWVSPQGTIHSLAATAAFGNYNQTYLSFPINQWIRDNINQNQLRKCWAVGDALNGRALILIASSGQTVNDIQLMMDYRFMFRGERFPRWARWNTYQGSSLAVVVDASARKRVFVGGNEGIIWKTDQANRTHSTSTAIAMNVFTPALTFGNEVEYKTIHNVGVLIAPKNNNVVNISWTRDAQATQNDTVSQGAGGDVLGPASQNPFILDTSRLGGARFVSRYLEEEQGGEFRSIQFQVSDSAVNSDLEVHGLSCGIVGGAFSTENV